MAINTTKSKVIKKSKLKKKIPIVKIFLRAEFNNTILTLTDLDGKVVAWSSSGKVGFKGAKKSTPFASQKVTEEILEKARTVEANTVHIIIKGSGMGRDSFLRSLQNSDFSIASIKDVTGFPFGGPRPKKKRRI
jgi:small subunit ribosomal protein S11